MAMPPLASLTVRQDTTLQQLQDFQQEIGDDGAKLRGTKNDDGSITLYAENKDSSFFSRLTGKSKKSRDNARTAISTVLMQNNAPNRKSTESLHSLINANRNVAPKSTGLRQMLDFATSQANTLDKVKVDSFQHDAKHVQYLDMSSMNLDTTCISNAAQLASQNIVDSQVVGGPLISDIMDRVVDGLTGQFDFTTMNLNQRTMLGASDISSFIKEEFVSALGGEPQGTLGEAIEGMSTVIGRRVSNELFATKMTSDDTITVGGDVFDKVDVLGAGGFGTATLFRCNTPGSPNAGKEVVLKTPPTNLNDLVPSERQDKVASFLNELDLHTQVKQYVPAGNQDNVLSFEGAISLPNGSVGILTEACTGGEMYDAMAAIDQAVTAGTMTSDQGMTLKLTMMHDMAKGLAEVNDAGFSHRDVKLQNVFVDATGVSKVADFGESAVGTRVNVANLRRVENPIYKAPEAIAARTEVTNASQDLKAMQRTLNTNIADTRLAIASSLVGEGGLLNRTQATFTDQSITEVDTGDADRDAAVMEVIRDLAGGNVRNAQAVLDAAKSQIPPGAMLQGDSADVWSFGTAVLEQFTPTNTLITGAGFMSTVLGNLEEYAAQTPTDPGNGNPPIPAPRPLSAGGFMVAGYVSPHANGTVTGDAELDSFISQTLQRDPTDRPDFDAIVQDPIFQRAGVGTNESRAVLAALTKTPPPTTQQLQQLVANM